MSVAGVSSRILLYIGGRKEARRRAQGLAGKRNRCVCHCPLPGNKRGSSVAISSSSSLGPSRRTRARLRWKIPTPLIDGMLPPCLMLVTRELLRPRPRPGSGSPRKLSHPRREVMGPRWREPRGQPLSLLLRCVCSYPTWNASDR
jgi:hypothetical protein